MNDQEIDKVEEVVDRTRHDVFTEMDVLEGNAWREQARWIKYEEDREAGAERWGKPHISSLTFTSLASLQALLESGKKWLSMEMSKEQHNIFLINRYFPAGFHSKRLLKHRVSACRRVL